jgi:hypothetical protein
MRCGHVAVAIGVAVGAVAPARASSFGVGPSFHRKTFLLFGADLGIVLDHDDSSWLVGGELSLAWINDEGRETPIWLGAYVDTLVDGLHDHARVSVGGEAGFGLLGVDVGPVFELGGAVSLRARAVLTVGVVSLYGGPVFALTGSDRSTWGELGLLLKAPIAL